MTHTPNTTSEEGITFFGKKPSEVLAAFHASGLSASGFSIAGRIVPHSAHLVGGNGEHSSLFDGEKLYAATFMRAGTPI